MLLKSGLNNFPAGLSVAVPTFDSNHVHSAFVLNSNGFPALLFVVVAVEKRGGYVAEYDKIYILCL